MNSPKKFNYELRPSKFTERKMLLVALVNICSYYKKEYQYIGFGGRSFTDFKLFHKELHIDNLISIEGGAKMNKNRVEFNKPYSFIDLKFGLSTTVLSSIDLAKESIIWLDYDNDLQGFMFDDLGILFKNLPSGSIYIFTCNRQLKDSNTGEVYTKEAFKEEFGDLVPFEIKDKDLAGENNFKTSRKMIFKHINNILESRNKVNDENLEFYQLFNFLYQENRGANMFSFGGIIENKGFDLKNLNLSSLDFIKNDEDPYRIKLPKLTNKEMGLINAHFDDEPALEEMKIFDIHEVQNYKKTYKYLPNYFDVRL